MKFLTTLIATTVLAMPASATTLRITVTNNQNAISEGNAGFALTPVYTALHNGNFDSVTAGSAVSAGVETLAELGNPSLLPAERTAEGVSPGSVATTISNGRPLFGGESATVEIDVNDFENQRYFSFLSMVIPSNDLFIANADPLAYNLFNDDGTFAGPQTIDVTGVNVWDAGTEANDALTTGGGAFVAGSDATAGVVTDGVATAGFSDLATYLGVTTVPGFLIDEGIGIDGFFGDFSNASIFSLATITIEQVAPVPLPAGGLLLLSGLGFGGFVARRKKKMQNA